MTGLRHSVVRVWICFSVPLAILADSESISRQNIHQRLQNLRQTVTSQQELIGALRTSTRQQAEKLADLKGRLQTNARERHTQHKRLQQSSDNVTGATQELGIRDVVSTSPRTPTYRYPYQRIAFFTTQSASQTVHMNGVVHFDNVQTNFRNSYDVTSSVFISPVPGVYLFSVSIASPTNSRCKAEFVKNGIGLGVVLADSVGSRTDIDQGSTTAVLSLDEGDKVWVRGTLSTQVIAGERDTMFSGALIWELA